MLCYGAHELATSFRTVRKNTIQVAEDIPEDKYGHQPAEGARTVAQMLTHVAITPMALWYGLHGDRSTDITTFNFGALAVKVREEENAPRTKAQIVDLLTREGEAFASFLGEFSDAELSQMVLGHGATGAVHKSRLEMLLGAKEHEMHHRGQLMLIERQLGVIPHLTRAMQARLEQMAAAGSARST
jgi:uncharacterized damage-inducible protein DinB